jgi:hypothetical protein
MVVKRFLVAGRGLGAKVSNFRGFTEPYVHMVSKFSIVLFNFIL